MVISSHFDNLPLRGGFPLDWGVNGRLILSSAAPYRGGRLDNHPDKAPPSGKTITRRHLSSIYFCLLPKSRFRISNKKWSQQRGKVVLGD